jgi:hypothetical protein
MTARRVFGVSWRLLQLILERSCEPQSFWGRPQLHTELPDPPGCLPTAVPQSSGDVSRHSVACHVLTCWMHLPRRCQRGLPEPWMPPQAAAADLCDEYCVTAPPNTSEVYTMTESQLAARIANQLGLLERDQEWLFCSEEGYLVALSVLHLARAMLKAGV